MELNGITRLIRDEGVSEYLLWEEARALKALEEWELREEIFWKQKAWIEWLQERDKNTTFFFNLVKARQHGNAISSLVTDRGKLSLPLKILLMKLRIILLPYLGRIHRETLMQRLRSFLVFLHWFLWK